jgi:hypothetical protein
VSEAKNGHRRMLIPHSILPNHTEGHRLNGRDALSRKAGLRLGKDSTGVEEYPNQDKLHKISVLRWDSNPGLPDGRPRCEPHNHLSRTSNIAFLMDWAQISDLDFGLIRQNTSIKKASFHYQGCPLSLKSGKLWLNSYVYWISITSNWFYSQQFSLPYSKNILSVCPFRGDKKKKKKVLVNPTEFFH